MTVWAQIRILCNDCIIQDWKSILGLTSFKLTIKEVKKLALDYIDNWARLFSLGLMLNAYYYFFKYHICCLS